MAREQANIWESAPREQQLAATEVHIWRAALDLPAAQVAALQRCLSADEQARAARYAFPHLRRRFTVARGMLRHLLGRYLDYAPAAICFDYTAHGKPFLATPQVPLCFNLSHSGELALVAATWERAIGVDIEVIRYDLEYQSLAAHYFAPSEQRALAAQTGSAARLAFFNGWTRKEAYLKARGDGLSIPLDSFSVSLAPHAPAYLLTVDGDPYEAIRWRLCALDAGAGYAAALAVEGHDWHLRCWQCNMNAGTATHDA